MLILKFLEDVDKILFNSGRLFEQIELVRFEKTLSFFSILLDLTTSKSSEALSKI